MNWILTIVAAIVGMIIGMVWYNPKVFGTVWMKWGNIKPSKDKKMHAWQPITAFVAQLIMAFVLAIFIDLLQSNIWQALMTALFLWIGFIATVGIGVVLWEGKSVKLYLLNSAYYLVVILVMAAIIAA